jgi:two-component system LytT family response regulator
MIVDDEPNAAALLESYVDMVSFLELRQTCYDAMEAFAAIQRDPIDIIFLDIQMQGLTGMEMAALLPPTCAIIFTTAYSEFAAESYEKNATDYLLKPILFKRFMEAVIKAKQKHSPTSTSNEPAFSKTGSDFVFLKSGKQLLKVQYASILYFEGDKEYVRVVSTQGQSIIYKRMKELEQQLPVRFARIHNSYIVNVDHIIKVEDNHVSIADKRISISDKYKDDFNSRLDKITL